MAHAPGSDVAVAMTCRPSGNGTPEKRHVVTEKRGTQ